MRSNQHDASVMFSVEIRNGLQKHQQWQNDGNAPTLTASMGMGGGYTPIIQQKIEGFNTEADGNSMTIKRQYQQTSQANLTRHDSFGATGAAVKIIADTENKEHPDIMVKLNEDCTVYAVWYEKYQCYIAIRKLTPKECYRLQGFSDDYFEKAQFVLSDSQLYKTAGNAVTVNVVYEIGKAIAEHERGKTGERMGEKRD